MSGANNVDGGGGGGGCLSSSSSSPPLPQCSGVGGGAGSGGSGGGDSAAVVPATATGGEDSPTPSECAAAAAAAVVSSSMTHHGGIGTAAGVDVGKEGVGTAEGNIVLMGLMPGRNHTESQRCFGLLRGDSSDFTPEREIVLPMIDGQLQVPIRYIFSTMYRVIVLEWHVFACAQLNSQSF